MLSQLLFTYPPFLFLPDFVICSSSVDGEKALGDIKRSHGLGVKLFLWLEG